MLIWISHDLLVEELEDLGLDTTAWTDNNYAKLDAEILKQQRVFERLTRRKFEQATIVEKLNGTGKESIVLRYFPIISISSIIIEDVPGYPYLLTLSEFRVDKETGIVVLVSTYPKLTSYFIKGKQNVTATYVYGYATGTIPEDIQDTILYMTLIGVIMRTPGDWEKLGLKSIRIAQYAESFGSSKSKSGGIYAPQKDYWADTIKSTIARYKRMPVL